MLPVDLPKTSDLATLMGARDDASVSIYLTSSPVPADHERIRLALRNAVGDAAKELAEAGVSDAVAGSTLAPIRELDGDQEFWRHQGRSLAILAAAGEVRTYRLANRVSDSVHVGDRYDLGTLLRARTFPHGGYVLGLAEQDVHLWALTADSRAHEVSLDLPSDLQSVLGHAENHGQADRGRARGDLGDRPERERFARAVQDAVLPHLQDELPLILAAGPEFDPAYRAINTHPTLLEERIDVHPGSLDVDSVDERARGILDATYARQLEEWREHFGTARSNGRATSKLKEVAIAATMGQVDDLHFDMDDHTEGTIDDLGAITTAERPGPRTYALVDEIAARVLNTGGTVHAVRNADLIDGSPVAALLRAPREAVGLD
ncbi:hypothetical protein [Litorihabitans aurantiacus]|uniref:Uncharacterized protein n=1 Tax=Litorihabitans aurantiacus TaxID=1930061 RepID=A0AA37UVP8_9MICO|nr:hypothetical protein [Litorihabitans aurantiacus]GMA31197.1 hypothetical protein GCM10025875_11890 [Litorihabitans aurantiacus]